MLPSFVAAPLPFAKIDHAGGVPTILDRLHAGQTWHDIAMAMGTSRLMLRKFVATLPPDVQTAIRDADQQGASALAESTIAIADEFAEEARTLLKPIIKDGAVVAEVADGATMLGAEKARIAARQWYAERKDKEAWGARASTEVTITNNTLHLDALRRRYTPDTPASGASAPLTTELPSGLMPAPPAPVSASTDLW